MIKNLKKIKNELIKTTEKEKNDIKKTWVEKKGDNKYGLHFEDDIIHPQNIGGTTAACISQPVIPIKMRCLNCDAEMIVFTGYYFYCTKCGALVSLEVGY